MARRILVTQQGDTVDDLAWRYLGDWRLAGLIYAANHNLCDQPVSLPGGLALVIPEPPAPEAPKSVSLWD